MANLITILRFPLLFAYVGLLYFGNGSAILWGVPFLLVIILMDSVDGFIARSRGEVSLLGSVLDIATDRTLEIVLWVVFADLDIIPVIFPLIVITRGTTVDAIRAVGMSSGLAPFEQVKARISQFLVSSPFMRSIYGVAKALAFVSLSLELGFVKLASPNLRIIHPISVALSWFAVSLTIARGLPVLIEGYALLKNPPKKEQAQSQPS
jgi:CDP-diacylglycerol--glycerol-3-phosphate 3-phosphatidyltransferase